MFRISFVDFVDNVLRDYIPVDELDKYDDEDIDANYVEQDDIYKRMRDRMAADEAMDAIEERRRERDDQLDAGLLRDTAFDRQDFDSDEEEEDIAESDRALNLEAFDSPLREWIAEERTRREIHRRFKKFLLSYYVGIEEVTRWVKRHEHLETPQQLPSHLKMTSPIYPPKIRYVLRGFCLFNSKWSIRRAMCASNLSSLEVSYGHLAEMQSLLAIWLTDVPKDMLEIFDEVLLSVVTAEFPHYKKVKLFLLAIDMTLKSPYRSLKKCIFASSIFLSPIVCVISARVI